jgi:hypothetical protein
MAERRATCSCAQLFVRCSGEPDIVSNCHCMECQRRTGSMFGAAAFHRRSNIAEIGGRCTKFSRRADSGRSLTFHFCSVCGSTVYWELEMAPELIGVALGAFADPTFPRPNRPVWTQRRHSWVALPDDMAQ